MAEDGEGARPADGGDESRFRAIATARKSTPRGGSAGDGTPAEGGGRSAAATSRAEGGGAGGEDEDEVAVGLGGDDRAQVCE